MRVWIAWVPESMLLSKESFHGRLASAIEAVMADRDTRVAALPQRGEELFAGRELLQGILPLGHDDRISEQRDHRVRAVKRHAL